MKVNELYLYDSIINLCMGIHCIDIFSDKLKNGNGFYTYIYI